MKTFLFLFLAACALLPARAQTPPAEWATACAGGPATYINSTAYYPYNPTSLTVDGQGNSYVVGQFTGSITLGATTLSATQVVYGTAFDTYLAKLDAQGQYQWAIQLGDGQGIEASRLAV